MCRYVSRRSWKLQDRVGLSVIIRDIPPQKKPEKRCCKAKSLLLRGRLASSVAHEINNPLQAVTNLLYLSRHSNDIGQIHEMLYTAEAELRRVSNIATQTLRFHKQSSMAICANP